MLEVTLFNAEKKHSYFKIFYVTFFLVLLLGVVNFFLRGISIFLIAFVCLALSYPLTRYVRDLNNISFEKFSHKSFFKRYDDEIFIFWSIFLASVLAFYLLNVFVLTNDFYYEKAFVESLTGNIVFSSIFISVFLNNLSVAFYTFLLSFFLFSGLIFVVIWNASIVSYYLYQLNSHVLAGVVGLSFVAHALLEIGGYVWAGILGSVLSYLLTIYFFTKGLKRFDALNKTFFYDCLIFVLLCVGFIFLGAVVETL